jgi:hypothetical protein
VLHARPLLTSKDKERNVIMDTIFLYLLWRASLMSNVTMVGCLSDLIKVGPFYIKRERGHCLVNLLPSISSVGVFARRLMPPLLNIGWKKEVISLMELILDKFCRVCCVRVTTSWR